MSTNWTTEMVAKHGNTVHGTREKSTETVAIPEKPITSHPSTSIAERVSINGRSDDGEDDTKHSVDLFQSISNVSNAKSFSSLAHEVLFVGVVCLSQFLTREWPPISHETSLPYRSNTHLRM
jgi:hypothetical protein